MSAASFDAAKRKEVGASNLKEERPHSCSDPSGAPDCGVEHALARLHASDVRARSAEHHGSVDALVGEVARRRALSGSRGLRRRLDPPHAVEDLLALGWPSLRDGVRETAHGRLGFPPFRLWTFARPSRLIISEDDGGLQALGAVRATLDVDRFEICLRGTCPRSRPPPRLGVIWPRHAEAHPVRAAEEALCVLVDLVLEVLAVVLHERVPALLEERGRLLRGGLGLRELALAQVGAGS
mmetsp:Transcript_31820/g.72435  ORF Transcript_31820/g.72435 Transcript_31820/m.72435 type:complete len:239 (-) Transcript_31820:261-977(-)